MVYENLLNASFRYISFRPRSEKEIRDFLLKKLHVWKTYSPAILEKIINRLKELGYVDDKKFIQWWIEQRQGRKPIGLKLIMRELVSKGVAQDKIEQILYSKTNDEQTLAYRAIEKKLHVWKNVSPLQLKKKIYDFLGRRGYHTDIIYRIIDAVLHNKV
ncbi:regulatory protein RecX [Candidatus Gottesmanbacteria bacterium]|nr:regulatory protein RecX [Candidatus Gottesmanbacteria bacterium]